MRPDERDVIFARMSYAPGSPEYREYYGRRPEREAFDAALRGMPPLGGPETPTFNPLVTPVADGVFSLLAGLHPLTDGPAAENKVEASAGDFTRWLKGLAAEAGASASGVVALTADHYYSHRGRGAHYGRPIAEADTLPHALVLAVPMNPDLVRQGPRAPEMVGTVLGYLEAAKVALALAWSVRRAGYRARAHLDGHYLLPLQRLARDGGLGVIGRHGLVITEKHGPCARLAAIDTDLPLCPDAPEPRERDVVEFCTLCGRCARRCPAVPKTDWPGQTVDADLCFKHWRRRGTDCGVCIAACPFTGGLDWGRLATPAGREETLAEVERGSDSRPDVAPPVWLTRR